MKKYISLCALLAYIASTTTALSELYTFDWQGPEGYFILGSTIDVQGGNIVNFYGGTVSWGFVPEGSVINFSGSNAFNGTSSNPYFVGTLNFTAQDYAPFGNYTFYYTGTDGSNEYTLNDGSQGIAGTLATPQPISN